MSRFNAARSVMGGKPKTKIRSRRGKAKVKKVMHEWGAGKLRSGSKKGPVVKSQRQAVAIALSEARKE
jgi:Family of unknown function (DUF6496)